jgi:phosphoribosylcarboxyaminoimidazole (NCAIR) mutase
MGERSASGKLPSSGGRLIMREAATAIGSSSTVRLSVNLSREAADALRAIADRHGITLTEAIRRAISTQKFVEDALDDGAKVLIAEPGESARELVFLR